jgi:two-component system phosphate regulon sensor histidine kinase PhoR
LLLAALAYLATRRLASAIERMTAAAERTAAGERRLDLPYASADELSRLAASVNRTKTALLAEIADLDEDRRLLSSVFAGMREGLLVVGPDRRIRLVNEAFRQIFGVPFDPIGRLLAEVIRDPRVVADLDTALEEKREIRESVVRAADSGRSFELHVTPLDPGALVLFFEVSRLEALERVRREFVANVSHELRTPLTSIKAFVETLLDGGVDDREHAVRFLTIVRRHADRMNALIDDLTDLSLIETGSVSLDLQVLDAGEVARDVVTQLAPGAGQEIAVRCEVPSPFPVLADRRRLEQVLVNLVDNAIKFNRLGGTVIVSGLVQEGHPVLAVEDTGVGIPADSLEKVFHRFYRVDKTRSREAGGTGLGLAIVKHLMRLHGGAVRLRSELGHGARFELEFPSVAEEAGERGPASGRGRAVAP